MGNASFCVVKFYPSQDERQPHGKGVHIIPVANPGKGRQVRPFTGPGICVVALLLLCAAKAAH